MVLKCAFPLQVKKFYVTSKYSWEDFPIETETE